MFNFGRNKTLRNEKEKVDLSCRNEFRIFYLRNKQ